MAALLSGAVTMPSIGALLGQVAGRDHEAVGAVAGRRAELPHRDLGHRLADLEDLDGAGVVGGLRRVVEVTTTAGVHPDDGAARRSAPASPMHDGDALLAQVVVLEQGAEGDLGADAGDVAEGQAEDGEGVMGWLLGWREGADQLGQGGGGRRSRRPWWRRGGRRAVRRRRSPTGPPRRGRRRRGCRWRRGRRGSGRRRPRRRGRGGRDRRTSRDAAASCGEGAGAAVGRRPCSCSSGVTSRSTGRPRRAPRRLAARPPGRGPPRAATRRRRGRAGSPEGRPRPTARRRRRRRQARARAPASPAEPTGRASGPELRDGGREPVEVGLLAGVHDDDVVVGRHRPERRGQVAAPAATADAGHQPRRSDRSPG